jgi:integrase
MTGHIRRRGEKTWELKFDIGTDALTGRRQSRYHSFKGTKREAEIELVRLMDGKRSGDYVDPLKLTFAEYLDRWERDWAVNHVSPKTLERYKELAKCHLRPHLGPAKLQKLRPVHFAGLYAKLLKEGQRVSAGEKNEDGVRPTKLVGLSPRTVGHIHRLLHRALGHAVQWGLLTVSPVNAIEPPPVEGTEIEILTEEQARAVLLKLRDRTLYPIVLLFLATGMRRGELLALRWKDVDLDGARLRVEQSLEQTKLGLRFKSPKTKHGRRAITLPASVVIELRAQRAKHQRIFAGIPDGVTVDLSLVKLPDDALVFSNLDGAPRKPNSLTTEWRRLVATLKLPRVSLHALRHTHASQLIASGMDVLTISRRLGHGSPMITLGVYGHLFSNTDDRAAQVMEAAFGKALKE